MKILLFPMRGDSPLEAAVAGEVLTVNGVDLDLSPLPDGATLPRAAIDCAFIAGDVRRIDGLLHVPLVLPHGPKAPEGTRFPDPILVDVDGPVALPTYDDVLAEE